MEKAVLVAEVKYPKMDNSRPIWVSNSSSCHTAMADAALDGAKINVNERHHLGRKGT
jgi:hypothetical protein